VFFLIHSIEIMAQSSRAAGKGQMKGKNVTVGVAPPPSSLSISVAAPYAASGVADAAASAANNPAVARQQAQEKNICCGSM
jgi:hypothetical protein